jgi:DNA polymerase III alpha subunit
VFDGKQDLEKQLVRKLRGWLAPDSVFLILRDQDAEDCDKVKRRLVDLCQVAGKPSALVRIACHELESFYLGDLNAVETGLGISNIAKQQMNAMFRNPDKIINPSSELAKLTKDNYQKINGTRRIAPHLSLENNRSRSFNVLLAGIRKLISAEPEAGQPKTFRRRKQ